MSPDAHPDDFYSFEDRPTVPDAVASLAPAVATEPEPESPPRQARSQARSFVAMIVIGGAVAQALGVTLQMPSQLGANDISRWCTVWSLLERGTYAIDDCPWQEKTQDKVLKVSPFEMAKEGEEPAKHYYSSKPPLLPTLIAGLLYPIRQATHVPLDARVSEDRNPRNVRKPDPDAPGGFKVVLETPPEPVRWNAYVFYFKPMIVLLNTVPLLAFLLVYARLLDRYAPNDWAWTLSLFAAAWGTQLFVFGTTLNNHTVATYSAFFAIAPLLRIGEDGGTPGDFARAGFFGAFCACNELPAALFGVLLFLLLLVKSPKRTLAFFVPAAIVPCAAFLATQYAALGTFKPVYSEFGSASYNYEGSYWNTPLEFDWFDKHPEPTGVYVLHMLVGHHGIFALTPIFLFSFYAAFQQAITRGRMAVLGGLTAVLSPAMVAFYAWKTHNYGGSTNGLRWLLWLAPFWLALLPMGVAAGQNRRWVRVLSLAALLVSIFSAGYGLRMPWSHPWVLDAMEHLGLYHLHR